MPNPNPSTTIPKTKWGLWFVLGPILGALTVGAASELSRAAFAKSPKPPTGEAGTTITQGAGSAASSGQNGGGTGNATGPCSSVGNRDTHQNCRFYHRYTRKIVNIYESKPTNEGVLLPANDPTPENACSVHSKDIHGPHYYIIMGSNAYVLRTHTIEIDPVFGGPTEVTFKTPEGPYIQLSFKQYNIKINLIQVFDAEGHNIVHMDDDGYWVLPTARMKTDKSTIQVFDYTDSEVFYMKYLNPETVLIRGNLRNPNGVTVFIGESRTTTSLPSSGETVGNCYLQMYGPPT